jgi:hypothetical protein
MVFRVGVNVRRRIQTRVGGTVIIGMPVMGKEEDKRQRAPKKDWKSIIKDTILSTLKDPRRLAKTKFNLRKMFYNLVVKEAIGNTESDYNTLSDQTTRARMNGLLPLDCFVDEVRVTIDNGYKDDDELQSVDDYLKVGIEYFRGAPEDYVKSLPTWYGQKSYVEEWLEKAAGYRTIQDHLGNRQARITIDRGNTSLSAMIQNVRRLRKVAQQEPDKEIRLKYYGDMDPSGDDMDRDLMQRILSVNAKINIDGFEATEFVTYENPEEEDPEKKIEKSRIKGDVHLRELRVTDWKLEKLYRQLEACPRENDDKDRITGQLLIGRNTIRDNIRIKESEIIAYHYPKGFVHLVPMTKEQEQKELEKQREIMAGTRRHIDKLKLSRGQRIIHFERVAITEDQIDVYGLPEMPKDKKTLDKLDRDTKRERFEDKYGRLMAVC